MPSISPIGIPSEKYSGSRLASIRQTTLTGPARGDDEVEQPQHLVEHEQHRGEQQRPDQRDRDRLGQVAIDQRQSAHGFCRPNTMIWPQTQPR